MIQNNETIGLGLYVSKNIINGLGGQIDFTSLHKEGSTFILSINAENDNKYPKVIQDSTNELNEQDLKSKQLCEIDLELPKDNFSFAD